MTVPAAGGAPVFSPVTFPASQLPDWFRAVHDVLPFRPARDLLRAGLDRAYDVALRQRVATGA